MLLVDYYRAAPDLVHFSQYWCPDTTMMDKIKVGRFTENLKLLGKWSWCSLGLHPPSSLSSFTGFFELPRSQRPGLLSDPRARLQSAEQHPLGGSGSGYGCSPSQTCLDTELTGMEWWLSNVKTCLWKNKCMKIYQNFETALLWV